MQNFLRQGGVQLQNHVYLHAYLFRLKRPEIKHFSRKLQNFLINKLTLKKGLKLSIFRAPKLNVGPKFS